MRVPPVLNDVLPCIPPAYPQLRCATVAGHVVGQPILPIVAQPRIVKELTNLRVAVTDILNATVVGADGVERI